MSGAKACACGRVHRSGEWRLLPYLGPMQGSAGEVFELRNCQCGSTIAKEAVPAPRDYARLPSTMPPPPGGLP